MKITLTNNKEKSIDYFIYGYLKDYIYDLFIKSVSLSRLKAFDDEFEIDSYEILRKAMASLLITKNGNNQYIIQTNNLIKVGDNYINYYINLITYGNREIKGYPIILDIFKFISNNITKIYREWEDNGYTILRPVVSE